MEPSLNEVCKKASTKQILDLRLSVCVFGNKLIAKNNSFFFKLSHKAEKNKGFLFLQNKQNQTNRTLKKKKKTIHSLPYHFPNIHTSTVTEMTKKKKDIKQKNQRNKNLGFHWHPILISKTKFGVGKKRNSPTQLNYHICHIKGVAPCTQQQPLSTHSRLNFSWELKSQVKFYRWHCCP